MTEVTRQQIADQLAGFPEACWAAATWPIDVQTGADRLKRALDTIHPELTPERSAITLKIATPLRLQHEGRPI